MLWQWSGLPQSVMLFSGALVVAITVAGVAMRSELQSPGAVDERMTS
jgi:hypothetical protein